MIVKLSPRPLHFVCVLEINDLRHENMCQKIKLVNILLEFYFQEEIEKEYLKSIARRFWGSRLQNGGVLETLTCTSCLVLALFILNSDITSGNNSHLFV